MEFTNEWADIDVIKRRIEGSRLNGKDVVLVEHTVMERLMSALENIAKQKLRPEMDEDVIEGVNADWESGYESCVKLAREALGI